MFMYTCHYRCHIRLPADRYPCRSREQSTLIVDILKIKKLTQIIWSVIASLIAFYRYWIVLRLWLTSFTRINHTTSHTTNNNYSIFVWTSRGDGVFVQFQIPISTTSVLVQHLYVYRCCRDWILKRCCKFVQWSFMKITEQSYSDHTPII